MQQLVLAYVGCKGRVYQGCTMWRGVLPILGIPASVAWSEKKKVVKPILSQFLTKIFFAERGVI